MKSICITAVEIHTKVYSRPPPFIPSPYMHIVHVCAFSDLHHRIVKYCATQRVYVYPTALLFVHYVMCGACLFNTYILHPHLPHIAIISLLDEDRSSHVNRKLVPYVPTYKHKRTETQLLGEGE